MTPTVQARLDRQSQRELERLVRQLGWSPSKVVREGIRLLASCQAKDVSNRIIGLGDFESGKTDLGSNKEHLRGFGG